MRNVIKQDSKKAKHSLQQSDEDFDISEKRRNGVDLLRCYPVNSDSTLDSENPKTMDQHRQCNYNRA